MSVGARWWFVLCLGAVPAAWAVVGGAPAAAPEPDAAVVFLQRHGRSCRIEGLKNDKIGYYSFLGIRYAEPPVGQRRFQRPLRRYLMGDVAAKTPCLPCPQPHPRQSGMIIGHEDCLCLSVYAPKMPGSEMGSPVVFFIHGGNYKSGSSSAYGGQHLVQKDTILVTLQYRLGSLGFLSTGQKDAAGNAGLFDMHAAMNWVHDYIEFFGGDPKRVVVMGQGSGGSAASLLALSGEGRSPRGVAALSGAPLSPNAVRPNPALHAHSLANHTGCPSEPAEHLLACLRKQPAEKIVKADSKMHLDAVDTMKFLDEISGRSGAGARVEGQDDLRGLPPLVSDTPAESLNKKQQRCPMLTGVNSAETTRAVHGKYESFLVSKLKSIQDFIKKDLIGGLRSVVKGVEGLVPLKGVHSALVGDYYAALFKNSASAVDGLAEIAEATADALFNFPAYQSVSSWSTNASAYLYSFEHLGNLTRGSHFLPGVALAEDEDGQTAKNAKGPAHGDELAYIFEPLDDEGNPVDAEVSSMDARVRDSFVGLIAKFAHDLSPMDASKSKNTPLLPFSKENDQFIKIDKEITLEKRFRFCQMGLWGDMSDRIAGAFCKGILDKLLSVIPSVPIKQLPIQANSGVPGGIPGAQLIPLTQNGGIFASPPMKNSQQSNRGKLTPFGF